MRPSASCGPDSRGTYSFFNMFFPCTASANSLLSGGGKFPVSSLYSFAISSKCRISARAKPPFVCSEAGNGPITYRKATTRTAMMAKVTVSFFINVRCCEASRRLQRHHPRRAMVANMSPNSGEGGSMGPPVGSFPSTVLFPEESYETLHLRQPIILGWPPSRQTAQVSKDHLCIKIGPCSDRKYYRKG